MSCCILLELELAVSQEEVGSDALKDVKIASSKYK